MTTESARGGTRRLRALFYALYSFTDTPLVHLRTPILPYATLQQLLSDRWKPQLLAVLTEYPLLPLAIYLSSKDLYRELGRWLCGGDEPSERALRKILSYALRSVSRATPFGLFAAVSPVGTGLSSTLQLRSPIQSHTRLDLAWVAQVLQELKKDPVALERLRVFPTRELLEHGDRITVFNPLKVLHSERAGEQVIEYLPVSFKVTAPVTFLQGQMHSPLQVHEVVDMLERKFGENQESCQRLVGELRDAGFLCDELTLVPLENPEQRAIGIVSRLSPNIGRALESLCDQVRAVDHIPIEQRSPDSYKTLVEHNPLWGDNSPSVVTAATREVIGTLGRPILDEVAAFAAIALHGGYQHLEQYRQRFVARYEGLTTEVPLLELVDPTLGLGIPDGLTASSTLPQPLVDDRVLLAMGALRDAKIEAELTEEQFIALLPPIERESLPSSLDLGFEVYAANLQAVEQGDFRIAPASFVASPNAGSVLGRFSYALSEQAALDLEQYAANVAALHPDCIFAELVVTPVAPRAINICTRPRLTLYQVKVGYMPETNDSSAITADDIVVGLSNNRFYLRSIRLGKRIILRESHLLNIPRATPPLGRLLSLLARDAQGGVAPFEWGNTHTLPFLPRLRCGKLIISKARWRFRRSIFEKALRGDFKAFMHQWLIPAHVNLVYFDNKLPVNLTTEVGRDLVMRHTTKENEARIVLEELLPAMDDCWLRDESGRAYRAEFIASAMRSQPVPAVSIPTGRIAVRADRVFGPGSHWLYFKLFADFEGHDRLLVRDIAPLLGEVGALDWFFVRYKDPQPHLRLRMSIADKAKRAIVSAGVLERFEILSLMAFYLAFRSIHTNLKPNVTVVSAVSNSVNNFLLWILAMS